MKYYHAKAAVLGGGIYKIRLAPWTAQGAMRDGC